MNPPSNDSTERQESPTDGLPAYGAWLCVGLGLLMLLLYPRPLQFASHALFGTHVEPFMLDGVEVPYTQTAEFWSDLGPMLLGLMLIGESITFVMPRNRTVLSVAIVLIAASTVYNLGYVAASIRQTVPVISFIAVMLGLPMTVDLSKRLRAARPSQNSA